MTVAQLSVVEAAQALQATLELKAREARTNFHKFIEFVMRDNWGGVIRQAPMHILWRAHIEWCWANDLYPAILAPYGHGKTVQCVVGLVAYELGLNSNLRCKVVCNNDARATERIQGITALLTSAPYKEVFPHIRPAEAKEARKGGKIAGMTKHHIYLERSGQSIDPSVMSSGVLGGGTGGRADLMLFDDICDEKNTLQEPAMMEKVASAVDNVWIQRIQPGGRVMYIGTPWHQGDYTHQLMKRPSWCVLRMWVAEDFSCLHQEVYCPPDKLKKYPIPRMSRLS